MKKRSLAEYLTLDYPVEVRQLPEEEGGGWIAYIPTLGRHLFRAVGDTRDEALRDLDAVRQALIADLYTRGEHIAEPPPLEEEYSGTPGLRMTKTMHALVARRAKEEGVSLNHYLNTLISVGLGIDTTTQAVRKEMMYIRRDIQNLASSFPNPVYDIRQPLVSLPVENKEYMQVFQARRMEARRS